MIDEARSVLPHPGARTQVGERAVGRLGEAQSGRAFRARPRSPWASGEYDDAAGPRIRAARRVHRGLFWSQSVGGEALDLGREGSLREQRSPVSSA